MPALTPKENWLATNRWDNFDALFRLTGRDEKEYALGATHEEIVTPLVRRFVFSYQDLPCAVYQIQDKFRNEPRAKSGLLRGREFNMKDLYSFHRDENDLNEYYEKAKEAYFKIFKRCGIEAILVEATGGAFSKFSHEFQVVAENGEDTVYFCEECGRHQNEELNPEHDLTCPYCGKKRKTIKAIEVGNIFKLGTRFSDAFDFRFTDEKGKTNPVLMGCYGIGPSRVLGAIVEVSHDSAGIIWPTEVAPFCVHLLFLGKSDKIKRQAEKLYQTLLENKIEILFDDRETASAAEKLQDSDLIGIPLRLVISEKTFAKQEVEIKKRGEKETVLVKNSEILKYL